ncbi:helix-turn-helix domain-containing protein [Allokutzneria sp. A3M-2-11 16]|uniref:helix-turn-helix domain-containing protein n=1 Tax=Allokutzneria sp. A3M-2-11 16 TaxID=2962043 RepID=UPI0020B7BA28|nr:helix-turn-helix transcriptional regulator [Allokutzneria sp. A3M-2-11 16]MCP3798419.1 helix-turn-helix domain-containing protein [Allokutzneria sp. A3M-2-11 16]
MLDPDRLPQDRRDLAAGLRRLRQAAGLSGERLAARAAMSQTKVSRIETGRAVPTVTDVELILKALDAPAEVTAELLDLARVTSLGYRSMRAYAEMGLWRAQEEITALVRSSAEVRQFLPVIPSGLLQTPDYARCVLTPTIPGDVSWDTERAVAARLATQATLDDASRRFSFLLTEHAVRWPCAPPDVMAGQCAHMARVAERGNVELAVIPQNTMVPAVPMNFFVVYDDRLVAVELFSGEVVLRDPKDIAYQRNVFDFFWSHAAVGKQAAELLSRIGLEFMPDRD